MRIKTVTTLLLGAAVIVAWATPALAQAKPAPASSSSSSSTSAGQFGIGYSFLRISGLSAGAGFDANYTKDVTTMSMGSVGYLVDFSVNHSGTFGTAEFVDGGVRLNFKTSGNTKATFYGLVTVGLAHAETTNNFAIDFGGGADIPLTGKNFGLFAQVDFPVVMFSGASSTGLRLNVGVTVPVGK